MVTYGIVQSNADLQGILSLQKQNLAEHLPADEIQQQGFVTVQHTLADLERMHLLEPSVIAKEGEKVIAYVLAMTLEARHHISILQPMFELFHSISHKGQPLLSYPFIMVGQVCVDKAFRGKGVFENLYYAFRDQFNSRYPFALTEIADRNTRSMRAHERIGFNTIHSYRLPDSEIWNIVVWDWQ